ncbi:MAG: alpha/beta hydrolase, partial [Candidatus Rokuibacteriota bacterium]
SEYVSDADVRRLEAAGCRVDTIEGAGHFLHVDRPEELLDRIVHGLA